MIIKNLFVNVTIVEAIGNQSCCFVRVRKGLELKLVTSGVD